MIPVYVPSRGRADERVRKGPAAQMPEGCDVTYVVSPEEIGRYAVALTWEGVSAKVVSCPLQPNIAAVRHWIGLRARSLGQDRFVICDDDVGFLVRRGEDTWQLRGTEPDEVRQMLEWMDSSLAGGVQNVGISAREGNSHSGKGSTEELARQNVRLMRVQGFQTEAFLACEHGRTRVMEDFDVSLQILEAGGSNLCSFWWSQGQSRTNEDGGCSEWRTHEVHEQAVRRLAELHPGLVTLTQKQNKTDADGFGTRVECIVQWKSAYQAGQRRVGKI